MQTAIIPAGGLVAFPPACVVSTMQGDSWSGAVRVRRLALGHLETPLGGAGDPTSNLQVTSRPALPPELWRGGRSTPTILTKYFPFYTSECL